MRYFLLVYNQATGELLEEEEFEEAQRLDALRARFAREVTYGEDPHVEVVVLGAESHVALTRTHARYFKDTRELLAT